MGDDALAEIFRMSAPALVAQFERLAGAPGGVARLRELILALAVRGKLVPQRNGDEPAGKFLASASETRSRMVAEGRLRRTAVVTPVEMSEHAYPLPPGWSWARIGDLGQVVGGGTPKSDIPELWAEAGVPWLTPADLYGRREMRVSRGRRDISPRGLSESSAQLLPPGTVLFSSRAPIGYVAIAEAPLATNQGFKSCVPFVEGVSEYLYWHLKQLAPAIDEAASGTTFKEISGADFAAVVIAVPPLAEQARIVARVDELMQLCDALETKGRLEAQQHARLLETLLGTLTESSTPEELAANWQRVAEHFDLLMDRPEAVDVLEQTILQLAVRGTLVRQDANDEPASLLLCRIRSDKDRLVAEGKIKSDKPLTTLDSGEVPFEIPVGWDWVRLGSIAGIERGGSPRPIEAFLTESLDGLNWIKIGDTEKGGKYITSARERIRPEGLSKTRKVYPGDFLLTNSMSFGRPYITQIEGCIHDGWLRISPPSSLNKDYLYLLLSSPFMRAFFVATAAGGVVQNLNADKVRGVPIPLPPLAEQTRIVTRVTELLRLCAGVRQRLAVSQKTQSHLAEALVGAATA